MSLLASAASAWEYVRSFAGLGAAAETEPEPSRNSIAAVEIGAATGWEQSGATAAAPPALPGTSGREELESLLRASELEARLTIECDPARDFIPEAQVVAL